MGYNTPHLKPGRGEYKTCGGRGKSRTKWTSSGKSVTGRIASTTRGPIVILGTKRPSMTSTWIQSHPASSTALICHDHISHRCCKVNHTQNLTAIQNSTQSIPSKLIEVYNSYMNSATKSAISSNLTSFLYAIIHYRMEHEMIGYNKGLLGTITADEIKLIKHPEVSNWTALLDPIPALPTLRSWRTRWKVTQ